MILAGFDVTCFIAIGDYIISNRRNSLFSTRLEGTATGPSDETPPNSRVPMMLAVRIVQ
jgi:hypothetical protein